MRLFVVASLVCLSMSAKCQVVAAIQKPEVPEVSEAPVSPLILNSTRHVAYKVSRPPGYRMRKAGTIMTIAGSALAIGGLLVYNAADHNMTYNSSTGYYENDPQEVLGIVMGVYGVGLTIPGIILWSKGGKKYKRYLERETAFEFKGNRFSLSYRF